MKWLTDLLLGGVVEKFTTPLLAAYQARLIAQTDKDRLAAEQAIKSIEAARDIAVIEAADRWSATRVGRWLIVVPFGLWWAAIYLIQIINPWFGLSLVVVDVPKHINDMALVLIPAIVMGDAGALLARHLKR
ncbi:hypothetical protein [Agrobacterium sp.]|uniref:hypothetical protein n=1 Tax=Agrobacterium sp. TaxID=361 RepID=UPI0028A67167|nr:hypothetical protein [Agrobacterium sp.]